MYGFGAQIRTILVATALLLLGAVSAAETDSIAEPRVRRLLHSIYADFRPEYIAPTNAFLRGANALGTPLNQSLSAHLRYGFRFRPNSPIDRLYGGVYQGLGVTHYRLGNTAELGNPTAIYLFQGARLARFAPRLSLNYEWNFGLSFGWNPYDPELNANNIMMGSKMNAYINAGFYLCWSLAPHLDLTGGVSLTHFSNGNTRIPNAGLNTIGARIGVAYHFGRRELPAARMAPEPQFPRHMNYDVMLFGAWRSAGVRLGDKVYAAPGAYPVAGFNLAALYRFGYKFRAGLSLDGVYDGSANIYAPDQIVGVGETPQFRVEKPGFEHQIALGVSARAEFVMPYFTINIGFGINALHKGGDLKSFYQMLALKVDMTRNLYLHIGYCLKDFEQPNYLMLGVGMRFNNKAPKLGGS